MRCGGSLLGAGVIPRDIPLPVNTSKVQVITFLATSRHCTHPPTLPRPASPYSSRVCVVQVVTYADILKGKVRAGRRVAVIGAGKSLPVFPISTCSLTAVGVTWRDAQVESDLTWPSSSHTAPTMRPPHRTCDQPRWPPLWTRSAPHCTITHTLYHTTPLHTT
jgi:hypothetical protein